MNRMKHFIGLYLMAIFLFFGNTAFADRVSNALKQIEKGDFEKAKSLLDKELEKNPTSAGALHIYGLYYFSEANAAYNIDSAYFFVLESIEKYALVDKKDSASWAKDGISIEVAKKLQLTILFTWYVI